MIEESDIVRRISSLGASGKHGQNVERDCHTMLRFFCRRFGASIETVRARMYDHSQAAVTWQNIDVIYPDSMASALYKRGDRVWQKTMFGGHAPQDVAAFWEHCKTRCSWFQNNKCFDYPALDKLVPISFYGDDISTWKGSECGAITILGWSSDLAYGNDSWTRYWPITVYPEYASTPWTYEDIMASIVPRVRDMCDPSTIQDWSDAGYAFTFTSLQGDLKWVKSLYHVHNYQRNQFCSNCGVVKSHPTDIGMTLGCFREDASHASSQPDLSDFHANRTMVWTWKP